VSVPVRIITYMKTRTVLVIGGGIGGLAAAVALANVGLDVTVAEQQSDLHASVYGVGIIQPVNALRALDVIGCARACLDCGYSTAAWSQMRDVEGNLFKETPGVTIPGSDLPPMNGLTRPVLHRILTDRALEVGVKIEYGRRFSELHERPSGVEAVYDDGGSQLSDIIVGADGVNSKVRRHVLGSDLVPRYIGQSAFRVNIPREPEIDRIVLQKGPDGMAGFVPIGPDLAYMFYNSTWDRDARLEQADMAQTLRECLAPFGGLAGRVRDNYINDSSAIVFRPEEWLIAPRPWHSGRVVLIGDAVHAVTPHMGQGAAQAIEDGVVLADCLRTADDFDEAFGVYADRRYDRCKLVVESSVAVGRWEMDPAAYPGFDLPGLTQRVLESMLQPI
jgi:2-polyprenyl-6-methoxyphenol hydroxylase-like FAD-dependent oxidoreductase